MGHAPEDLGVSPHYWAFPGGEVFQRSRIGQGLRAFIHGGAQASPLHHRGCARCDALDGAHVTPWTPLESSLKALKHKHQSPSLKLQAYIRMTSQRDLSLPKESLVLCKCNALLFLKPITGLVAPITQQANLWSINGAS